MKSKDWMETLIKISADSIQQLRKCDVERVLETYPEYRQRLANYIAKHREDLREEVTDRMAYLECEEQPWPQYTIFLVKESWQRNADGETTEDCPQVSYIKDEEVVGPDELRAIGREFGLCQPSDSSPSGGGTITFASTEPEESAEHFERGIDAFYRLTIFRVGDEQPTPEDYQQVADLLGARFSQPLATTREAVGPQ